MDAHKVLITGILGNSTQLEVPFFQRGYVWEEDLWKRFLEDMEYISETQTPHFLGSIILKEMPQSKENSFITSFRSVVDGQQRLTTVIIFMKVLALKKGQQTMFDMQFRTMDGDPNLVSSQNDKEHFGKVMDAKEAKKLENPSGSNIVGAFNFFVDMIDSTKLDIMSLMRNMQFVKIDLEANEDEQQIFDTINSLGVNLTTAELLKNYFFTREDINRYESKWQPIFEKDEESRAYWDTEVNSGGRKRAMIDVFFDSFFELFIQGRHYGVRNEDKTAYTRGDRLFQSYKHFVNNYCEGNKNHILEPMGEYARSFQRAFRPDMCDQGVPRDFGMERMNIIIFGLIQTTLIPYVLFIEQNAVDAYEKARIYGILESYFMRRIINRAPSNGYNGFFASLIANEIVTADALLQKLNDSANTNMYVPDDDQLRKGLLDSKLTNGLAKGVLYLLESRIRPEESAVSLLGFSQYSLEHLMPKKWRNNWDPCDDEGMATKRDNRLLTLGNLAIIPQKLNASLKDADWTTKRQGKNKRPGLMKCADGLITMASVVNKPEWNEEEITKRAEWLFEQAREVWALK